MKTQQNGMTSKRIKLREGNDESAAFIVLAARNKGFERIFRFFYENIAELCPEIKIATCKSEA